MNLNFGLKSAMHGVHQPLVGNGGESQLKKVGIVQKIALYPAPQNKLRADRVTTKFCRATVAVGVQMQEKRDNSLISAVVPLLAHFPAISGEDLSLAI